MKGEPAGMKGRAKSRSASDALEMKITPEAVTEFILSHGGRTPDQPKREKPPTGRSRSRRPLRFIDLFCGIGGFRLAFERAGAQCVFSSDWDKFSRQTYAANFGEEPAGDINPATTTALRSSIICAGSQISVVGLCE